MTNTYTPQERRFSLLGLWTTIKILLILGGNFFVLSGALGQTNTWTGSGGNTLWHNTGNWSLGSIPTNANDVVISSSVVIDIGTGVSVTINSLRINNSSNVSFIAVGANRIFTIDDTGSSIDAGSSLTIKGSSTYTMTVAYTGTNR
ncbi:MAG TPA: hypothetical protein PLR30_15825, partial [Saprospiraceae bacterium]|nr:hypothetical protein [Saprospiraceae bacterium]